ncbi:MAG: hypothetical protein ACP5OG_00300 [Candidatus Nanoarchaeia archaeon]
MESDNLSLSAFGRSIEPEDNSKVILKKDFDPIKVNTAFKEFFKDLPEDDEDSRLFYFTEPHVGSKNQMGLFGDFAPSVVFATNRFNNFHLPVREKYLNEFAYSKLCHLYCTLDKSIMFGFQNKYMARSKIHNLNSVAAIFHRHELQLDDTPLKEEDINEEEVIKMLFNVKKNSTKLFNEVKIDSKDHKLIESTKHNFSYPSLLEKIVGENNLTRILLYGSSAKGNGNDFDNFGVLKAIPDNLYDKIRNSKPSEAGKEVGVIFVPEKILENFLYVNVSNSLFRENALALKGNFKIPVESSRYQIFKEAYHAGFGSAKLLSGLNLVYRRPDIFFDKPGLFDYFMKLTRFTLQGLSQKGKYKALAKEEVLLRLKEEFDFEIPAFRQDNNYLQECFLKANKTSIDIAKKLYDSNLAKEEKEALVEVKNQLTKKIFKARYHGKDLYVFGGKESINLSDIVPVKILDNTDSVYHSKKRELYYRGITNSKDIYLGKRV